MTVESDWGLPTPIAVLFAAMTVAPLLALPRRPLLAWRLTVLALLVCTFNAPADQSWPWTPPLALGSVAVLAGVVARVDRPVLPSDTSGVRSSTFRPGRLAGGDRCAR
ncbi:hypothetical protein [Micromonospora sp. NPDC093244]|uniref:hypothetical protein n=1 Tax=Micromonospora sp. NPDC093244 TaxID=3155071 RepID=UPI00342A6279